MRQREQVRTCKQDKENDAKGERDRVRQKEREGVDSTPGTACRQHLQSSVFTAVQILVSGSQVVPSTQWSLKPAHGWLSSRSESINNQLVSQLIINSQSAALRTSKRNSMRLQQLQHRKQESVSKHNPWFQVCVSISCTCWTIQVLQLG